MILFQRLFLAAFIFLGTISGANAFVMGAGCHYSNMANNVSKLFVHAQITGRFLRDAQKFGNITVEKYAEIYRNSYASNDGYFFKGVDRKAFDVEFRNDFRMTYLIDYGFRKTISAFEGAVEEKPELKRYSKHPFTLRLSLWAPESSLLDSKLISSWINWTDQITGSGNYLGKGLIKESEVTFDKAGCDVFL